MLSGTAELATTDTSSADLVATASTATASAETNAAADESDASELLANVDTDAIGIDSEELEIGANENLAHESEKADLTIPALQENNDAADNADGGSVVGLDNTEAANTNEVASADTNQIMKDELITQAEPEVEPVATPAPAPEPEPEPVDEPVTERLAQSLREDEGESVAKSEIDSIAITDLTVNPRKRFRIVSTHT